MSQAWSYHGAALKSVVDGMLKSPGWQRGLYEVCSRLNAGRYPHDIVDCLVQLPDDPSGIGYTVYDAYVVAHVLADILSGKLVAWQVPIGVMPSMDAEVAENNDKLSRCFASPGSLYSATFWGGTAEVDGFCRWHRPLMLGEYQVPPHIAPLEVGTTSASRTILHLAQSGCLARWPYGAYELTLLFAVAPCATCKHIAADVVKAA